MSMHAKHITFGILFGIVAWSFGAPVQAARLTVTTVPTKPVAGEEFVIEARLLTDGDAINAAEGTFALKGFTVKSVSTGGSAFTLWPVEPRYAPGSHSIEFAGGAPTSIEAGGNVPLLSIRALAPAAGSYTLSLESARAFKSDGRGTPVGIPSISKEISVAASGDHGASVPKDMVPPEFVSVEVGRDASLFDGKAYISFFASDDQSGVATYEVREGFFSLYQKADRYYVLNDQSQGKDVWVRVTDAAGNSEVYKIPSAQPRSSVWWVGGILLIVMALGIYWYRVRMWRRH